MRLLTFGHGATGKIELAALIRGAGIEQVIDVRSVPKSRAHPHVWSDEMAAWVPDLAGARYEWRPALGGFRRTRPDSPNVGLRHPSFRGYADYMQTEPFFEAFDALLQVAAEQPTAIMCSETLWWRCHRRLISDAAVLLHQIDVQHLFHTGKLSPHHVTDCARVLPEGILQYDD
ncbi:MAG: DUF488 domain-containing protein [Candidatus Eremiobacteraeota bacterium]|nr:DUF488 domain-containing protein [Candidatus Eremiobacteraeota bacterium]